MSESIDLLSAASDAALVKRVRRNGSERAFTALYDRHTPRAYRAAWRILGGNDHEAEDAVQEAWLRAIASLGAWSGESPFGAWFRAIATHVAVDMVRKNVRFASEVDAEWEEPTEERTGERLDLEAAILSLAAGYRTVLVLHDIEGFTHEEIAERLGITAGTSKGQLFKARRAVRMRLASSIEGDNHNVGTR